MPRIPRLACLAALAALGLVACLPPADDGWDVGRTLDASAPRRDAGSTADGAGAVDATPPDSVAPDQPGLDSNSEADRPGTTDATSADAAEPVDARGSDDAAGADDAAAGLWCTAPTPTLLGLSAEELHALLPVKDFLLINVADSTGAQIPGTDTFIDYRDVDGLAAYIGPALDTKVVLYCQSGNRSSQAGTALVGRGYCAVRHLLGGRNAWSAAGYSFE